MKLIAKYEAEQKELSTEVASLEEKFTTIRQDEEDMALFMERLRKYTDVQELTREMCLKLIKYITLDAYVEGQPREIYINYKLLDEPQEKPILRRIYVVYTPHESVLLFGKRTTLNKYVHSSFAQKALLMDRLQLLV
jgi:hypothetical protein